MRLWIVALQLGASQPLDSLQDLTCPQFSNQRLTQVLNLFKKAIKKLERLKMSDGTLGFPHIYL